MLEVKTNLNTLMNATTLFLGVIFSSIGIGYFIYGKRQKMTVPFIVGVILMLFPYFVESPLIMVIIGLILCVIPWMIRA